MIFLVSFSFQCFLTKKNCFEKKRMKVVEGFLHALTIHVAMLLHVKDIYQVVNSVPLIQAQGMNGLRTYFYMLFIMPKVPRC